MEKHQQRVVIALRRGKWFLSSYAQLIGPSEVERAQAELDEAIAAMSADAALKSEAREQSKSGTLSKNALRAQLRKLMGPVAASAEGGFVRVAVAEMKSFRVPDSGVSDVSLIAAARAMAAAASTYRPQFESYGRPSGFVEAINSAATALEQRIIERDGESLKRRRARLGIGVNVRKARSLLVLLNRVVEQKLQDRPDLIGAWRMAIRVGRGTGPALVPAAEAQAA